MSIRIRALAACDVPLLRDFLYAAIYVPEGAEAPPRDIVDLPELALYIAGFGTRPGDLGFVAECEDEAKDRRVVGMCWARRMRDYGYVDDETPSLSLAVLPEARGRGIGTALLRHMLAAQASAGVRQLSLSVQRANPARRLYLREGFTVHEARDEDDVMVRRLSD